jgi:hypothetical protein
LQSTIDAHGLYFALLGIRGQAVMVDPAAKVVVFFIAANALNDFPARREEYSLFAGTLRALRPRRD